MLDKTADIIVIGGGVAGLSSACELAKHASVILLEREEYLGYHSTGRSAAIFSDTYEPKTIQTISRLSRSILSHDALFAGSLDKLLKPRGILHVAKRDQAPLLDRFLESAKGADTTLDMIKENEVYDLIPILKRNTVSGAIYERDACDIEVSLLQELYRRTLLKRGGVIHMDREVLACRRANGCWSVETSKGAMEAPVLVNAAGAWADDIAQRARLPPLDMTPLIRTAIGISLDHSARDWPMTRMLDNTLYFKPEGAGLMACPFDERPSPPCDAQPEDIDVATAAWRLEEATTVRVERINSKWAGLRTYLPDRRPAVGFAAEAEGFFWLAALGGFGVQTSPAIARLAAHAIQPDKLDLPAEFNRLLEEISPIRLQRASAKT